MGSAGGSSSQVITTTTYTTTKVIKKGNPWMNVANEVKKNVSTFNENLTSTDLTPIS